MWPFEKQMYLVEEKCGFLCAYGVGERFADLVLAPWVTCIRISHHCTTD